MLLLRQTTILLFFSICCFSIISSCSPSSSLPLAQVGEERITWEEFKPVYDKTKKNYDPHLLESESGLEIKRNILEQYIDKKLLLNLAKSFNVSISDEELKKYIEILKGPADPKNFEKLLKERQISYNDWIQTQRDKLILSKLIKSELRSKIEITNDMMRDYYRKNLDKYKRPEKVHALHLMVLTRKKAEALHDLLKKGGDFSEIARKHSESPDAVKGGDLGYFTREQYPPTFDEACFSLKEGEISDIVASNYGFHIFKVLRKKRPQKLSFKNVKERIQQELFIKYEKHNLDQWLIQLRQEHPVSIDTKNLNKI